MIDVNALTKVALDLAPLVRRCRVQVTGPGSVYVAVRLSAAAMLSCGLLHWLVYHRRWRLEAAVPGYRVQLHVSCFWGA